MKPFFRLQIIAGFLIIVSAMGVLTYLSEESSKAFLDNTKEIIHYNQILYHTEQARSVSMDLETSQRGYTITQDSAFLDPYHAALPVIDQNVNKLEALLAQIQLKEDPIRRLRRLIRRKNDSTRKIIQARNHSFDSARQMVASYMGKNTMDSIRMVTDHIETEVNKLLTEKRLTREREIEKSKGQVILIITTAVVLLIILLSLIDYNFRKRIKAERSLQKTLQEKDNLYQKSPCGYFSVDRDLVLTNINATFLTFLGYNREELVGKVRITDLLHGESKATLEQSIEEFNGESLSTVDLDFVTRDQQIFSGTASLQTFHGNGHDDLLRCSIIDSREKRIANNKILQLNKELEEFSYSVSHDLRSPLRLINGYALMLKEDHPELLNTNSENLLNIIINNAKKMGNLIDDLLSFARLSRTEVNKQFVDFHEMIHSSFREVTALQGENEIEMKIGDLVPVESDVLLMKQVWLNLLSNAVKYSSKRDRPVIEIGSYQQENQVCYYVKDNGVGFDMDYGCKLFQVFQRLHRDDEFPGTGVGLALVKKIITRQGGSVWAESKPEQGATFHFSLPTI